MPEIRKRSRAPLERDIQAEVRLALGALPWVVLWRNAQASGRIDGRWVQGGLGEGSADLVGLVGPQGRFFALELKRPRGGVVSAEQRAWMAIVNRLGGYAAVCRSAAEAVRHAEAAARGETAPAL